LEQVQRCWRDKDTSPALEQVLYLFQDMT
jgi:hypothetical protein